jgi:hypothetical protein
MQLYSQSDIRHHLNSLSQKGTQIRLAAGDIDGHGVITKNSIGADYVALHLLKALPREVSGRTCTAIYQDRSRCFSFSSMFIDLVSDRNVIIAMPRAIVETQRRRHPRYTPPKDHPRSVYVCAADKCVACTITDISQGGLSLESAEVFLVGADLHSIRIILPRGATVTAARGVVRYCNPTGSNLLGRRYRRRVF